MNKIEAEEIARLDRLEQARRRAERIWLMRGKIGWKIGMIRNHLTIKKTGK